MLPRASKATSCAPGPSGDGSTFAPGLVSALGLVAALALTSALALTGGCRWLASYDPAGVDGGPQVGVRDLWAAGPAEVWVVRAGGVSRYDGTSWSPPRSITANTLLTIDGVGGRIFAAGDASTVLRR